MLISFLAANWAAVLVVMATVMFVFVFVAGRGAKGGLKGRAGQGWGKWMEVSRKAGEVQARIILTLFYFTLALPFGLVRTHFADPLLLKRANQPRAWLERRTRDLTLDDARKQF